MQGVVTLNDILDGLVGCCDTSGIGALYILPMDDGKSYLVDARCPGFMTSSTILTEATSYQPANYASIGGLILENTRKIPVEGENIKWNDFCLKSSTWTRHISTNYL